MVAQFGEFLAGLSPEGRRSLRKAFGVVCLVFVAACIAGLVESRRTIRDYWQEAAPESMDLAGGLETQPERAAEVGPASAPDAAPQPARRVTVMDAVALAAGLALVLGVPLLGKSGLFQVLPGAPKLMWISVFAVGIVWVCVKAFEITLAVFPRLR
jgi:hypothetical protein